MRVLFTVLLSFLFGLSFSADSVSQSAFHASLSDVCNLMTDNSDVARSLPTDNQHAGIIPGSFAEVEEEEIGSDSQKRDYGPSVFPSEGSRGKEGLPVFLRPYLQNIRTDRVCKKAIRPISLYLLNEVFLI